jgi:hypothetical protein
MLQLSLLIFIEANTRPGLHLQVKPEDLTTKSVRDIPIPLFYGWSKAQATITLKLLKKEMVVIRRPPAGFSPAE